MLIKCKILLFDFPTLYLAGISHHQARRITILKPHEFLWYKLSHHYIRVLIVYICIGLRLSVKMSLVSPLLLKLSQHSSPASPTSRPSLLSLLCFFVTTQTCFQSEYKPSQGRLGFQCSLCKWDSNKSQPFILIQLFYWYSN